MAATYRSIIRRLFDFAEIRKACDEASDDIASAERTGFYHLSKDGEVIFAYCERLRGVAFEAYDPTVHTVCSSVFVGSIPDLCPSHKRIFAKHSARESNRDQRFIEALEQEAWNHGLVIESSGIDENDLYATRTYTIEIAPDPIEIISARTTGDPFAFPF